MYNLTLLAIKSKVEHVCPLKAKLAIIKLKLSHQKRC